jgi:hypothetical protein
VKNTKKIQLALLAGTLMILAACLSPYSGPEGEGGDIATFTINLGGATGRFVSYPPTNPGDIAQLRYVVRFISTGTVIREFNVSGSSIIQGEVPIGTYVVTLDIFRISDGSLFAVGEGVDNPNVQVKQGHNNIQIQAQRAVAISPFDSDKLILTRGQTLPFAATIPSGSTPSVNWSVSGATQPGTTIIPTSGLLSVDISETAGALLTITATVATTPPSIGFVRVEISDRVYPLPPTLYPSDYYTGGTVVGGNNSSFTPPTATAGTTYYWVVVINNINDNGDGAPKTISQASTVERVDILQPVTFVSATPVGTLTTTSLTLTFNTAISGLTQSHITLTGGTDATLPNL